VIELLEQACISYSSMEPQECVVCMENLILQKLPCSHELCTNCIQRIAKDLSVMCPLCRCVHRLMKGETQTFDIFFRPNDGLLNGAEGNFVFDAIFNSIFNSIETVLLPVHRFLR
jgi:hypothetical protein